MRWLVGALYWRNDGSSEAAAQGTLMNHTELRALVARMQEQVALAATATAGDDKLTPAWDSLVAHLAVGPVPDTQKCPHCTREIMRAATLCGYCWTKLQDTNHA
jgi:hypothetical protein